MKSKKVHKYPSHADPAEYPDGYIPVLSPLWKIITHLPLFVFLWVMTLLFPEE